MPNGNTVKHGWILLLFVSLYITKRSEAVLQWGERKNIKKSMINGKLVIEQIKEKSIQCEDFDEDTGEKEYTMLWKRKQESRFLEVMLTGIISEASGIATWVYVQKYEKHKTLDEMLQEWKGASQFIIVMDT